jgi:hypothetical protein
MFFFTLFGAGCTQGVEGGSGAGGGGSSGGTGGTGGGEPLLNCSDEEPVRKVGACVYSGPPSENQYDIDAFYPPFSFAGAVTVTAVRPTNPDEPCVYNNWWWQTVGRVNPDTMIDVADAMGTPLTLGIVAPGFSTSTIAVGDTLDVDVHTAAASDSAKAREKTRLRIERGGQLLVTVGANEPIVPFAGTNDCFVATQDCTYAQLAMQVEDPQGATISIPVGTSAEVGSLLVTNEKYFGAYESACNFGSFSSDYVISAVPKP